MESSDEAGDGDGGGIAGELTAELRMPWEDGEWMCLGDEDAYGSRAEVCAVEGNGVGATLVDHFDVMILG